MSDMISRATLLKALRKEQRECEKDGEEFGGESILFAEAFDDVIDMVKTLPTVYAVPVVHARWASDEEGNTVCTGCGKHIPSFPCYNEETDEEWDEEIDQTPFCPNCGAKMDGGDENEA